MDILLKERGSCHEILSGICFGTWEYLGWNWKGICEIATKKEEEPRTIRELQPVVRQHQITDTTHENTSGSSQTRNCLPSFPSPPLLLHLRSTYRHEPHPLDLSVKATTRSSATKLLKSPPLYTTLQNGLNRKHNDRSGRATRTHKIPLAGNAAQFLAADYVDWSEYHIGDLCVFHYGAAAASGWDSLVRSFLSRRPLHCWSYLVLPSSL